MAEIETANLIDFSAEDLIQIHTPPQSDAEPQTTSEFEPAVLAKEDAFNSPNISSSLLLKQDSLDNNPFDNAQKMACRPPDPFDIVEKEACQKARLMLAPVEVKEGKLLSLSNDSFPNDSVEYIVKDSEKHSSELDAAKTLDHVTSRNIVAGEDTPTSTENNFTPDSETALDSASSTESPTSAKTKKTVEHRKRLLKLSLSNSTFNSPVSRYTPTTNEGFADDNSAVSMILSEAAQLGEHLIAQESPLKLVDDDLISMEPNWNDSQQDFDDDLEMLKVKIPQVREETSTTTGDLLAPNAFVESKSKEDNVELKQIAPLIDLAAIRAKLKVKRDLSNTNQDISLLIESLKHLITDIDVDDTNKKKQAANLLDALSSALAGDKIASNKPKTEVQPSTSPPPPPQTIVRQKTFDIQLEEKEEPHQPTATFPHSAVPCYDMPDIMIKSAATYDGETAEDKQDLDLPEIHVESASPPPAPAPQLDVNDIVEQLGKLLEQHQFNNIHATETGVDGSSHTATINPTFIVVMNTPQPSLTSPINNAHQRRSCVDNSSHVASSPDFIQTLDTAMRRRSQSLSIHDKIKVVQLPIIQPNAVPVSTGAQQTTYVDVSPTAKASFDKRANEFKTPSRTMRRNSFSNVTPCSSKYSNYMSIAQRRASGISNMPKPSSSVLATHHEQGERKNSSTIASAIVCPMQNLNLNSMNTQLTTKKRIKNSNSTDSILKSSAPMKATIPVKKVAPMIKTPPSNCVATASKTKTAISASVNISMELLAKSSNLTCTNTPMTLPQLAGVHDVSSGFPNACSTPTVRITPSKRSTFGPTAKSRYSQVPPPPSNRLPTHSAAAASTRRRTISEFKAKSPIKPRLSSIGGSESAATISHVSTVNTTKSTIKKPQTAPRTVNKVAPTVCGKTSTRLSTRTSFGGTAAAHRNKENKYP